MTDGGLMFQMLRRVPANKYHCFGRLCNVGLKHILASLLGRGALCVSAIVMDRATAGLLFMPDRPADLLWRASVCMTAVQSVNDKEENDVMGGETVADTGDEMGGNGDREKLAEMKESSTRQ